MFARIHLAATLAATLAAALAVTAPSARAQDSTTWLPDPPHRTGYGNAVICTAEWGGNRIERYVTPPDTPGAVRETILTTTLRTDHFFLFARPTQPGNRARIRIRSTAVDLGFGLDLSLFVPVRIETDGGTERVDFFHTADPIFRPSVQGVADPGVIRLMTISAHVGDRLLDALAASGYLGMVYLGRGPDAEWAMPVDLGNFAGALSAVTDCAGG